MIPYVLCLLMSMQVVELVAYPHTVADQQRDLNRQIQAHPAAAILLYAQRHKRGTQQVAPLVRAFKDVARSEYYPKTAMLFLSLDAQSPVGKRFMRDYGVVVDQLPTMVMLRNGVLVRDQRGAVTVPSQATAAQVHDTIHDYAAIDMAKHLYHERKAKEYEKVVRNRVHLYYTPYFDYQANPWNGYWGWPYYGMAQGNYGGNAGAVFTGRGVSLFGSNY